MFSPIQNQLLFKTKNMNKEELAAYIRHHDPFFRDADFNKYSYYEMMIIKVSIEVEKAQSKNPEGEKNTGISSN